MKLDQQKTLAIVTVEFPPTPSEGINIGALHLSLDGREFIYDAVGTDLSWEGDEIFNEKGDQLYTALESGCWANEGEFPDCAFDLMEEDLSNPNLKATFFVEGFDSVEEASVEAVVHVFGRGYHLTNVKFE